MMYSGGGISKVKRMRSLLWRWRKTVLCVTVVLTLLNILVHTRSPCLWSYLFLQSFPTLRSADQRDVTVISAYMQLDNFHHNSRALSFYKYLRWAETFQYLQNPLVVFTDSEQVETMLLKTRSHLADKTRVIRIHRSQLKAFKDVEKIRTIFRDPQYPKHPPNTVIPEYPCTQHAKYEFMLEALERNYFPSTYIAWLDIGYFRHITERRRNFYMVTPPSMDESKIAMTGVHRPDWSLDPGDVFRGNLVWVGGGMSVGRRPVYRRFVEDYMAATATFLDQGLSNTDQQVIYSMFTHVHRVSHKMHTAVQTYTWFLNDLHDCWFYLGYLCYRELPR